MEKLPVFLSIQNRPCLVIGNNERGLDKIKLLLKAGGKVHLFAEKIPPSLKEKIHQNDLTHLAQDFEKIDFKIYKLIFVTDEDPNLIQRVIVLNKEMDIPISIINRPDLSTFLLPSIVDRSPLVIAVSTNGKSPTLSKIVRKKIESFLPHRYGALAKMIQGFREGKGLRSKSRQEKTNFWEKILSGPMIDNFLSGREGKIEKAILNELEQKEPTASKGKVILAGAGPGDPELLTLKALRYLQKADVILYDRLAGGEILNYARESAELIYVGKKRDSHFSSQEETNQALIAEAKKGKLVLRLKGGDPFIFGRGGEEVDELIAAGIDFEVIPGITAASGCSTYAGIPLTHRDYAQSCIFVTGHGKAKLALHWDMLAQANQTVVFYMGLANLSMVCSELVAHGLNPKIPVALIEKGTTKDHKTFVATLATVTKLIEENEINPPTIFIVGEVVRFASPREKGSKKHL